MESSKLQLRRTRLHRPCLIPRFFPCQAKFWHLSQMYCSEARFRGSWNASQLLNSAIMQFFWSIEYKRTMCSFYSVFESFNTTYYLLLSPQYTTTQVLLKRKKVQTVQFFEKDLTHCAVGIQSVLQKWAAFLSNSWKCAKAVCKLMYENWNQEKGAKRLTSGIYWAPPTRRGWCS